MKVNYLKNNLDWMLENFALELELAL